MGKNKSINPVEKARRQAKQKDAKKQKKQRIEARNLNLRGRNPTQIILELERLDQIEYSLDDEGPKLNEKVIANKRKKMLDLWIRVLNSYRKDDPQKFTELKRMQMEYEANKVRLVKNYEAINSAKKVDLEQIPLPSGGDDAASTSTTDLNPNKLKAPKFLMINGEVRTDLRVPGCPALLPPSLEELEDELKISSSADLDEFLKEVDQVEKMASSKEVVPDKLISNKETNFAKLPPPNLLHKPPIASLPNTTINPAPFPVLLNPMGINPMSINPHSIKKPGLMPPGAMLRPPPPIPQSKHFLPNRNQQSTIKREPTGPTIEAKPQLRNLSADLTKFLPTSLRIKRNQPEPKKTFNKPFSQVGFQPRQTVNASSTATNANTTTQANKDTAYEDFMKEISGLTD